jgi:menaquinone-9 beta-reductase
VSASPARGYKNAVRPAYQVIVAGAGPAGVAVAARLAQHGAAGRVLVLDRFRFPREKPCGGALTGHAEPVMAELDLALRVPSWPCPEARVRFGGFERVVAMGRAVRVIRRRELDADLVDQVRARGVEVIEGEGVEAYATGPDGVTVTTSQGRQLCAEVLIGADGAASVVRRQVGGGRGDRQIPHRLFQIEVEQPGDSAPPAMLYDFTPMAHGLRGYLWIFPVPGRMANLGLMHYPTRAEASRRGGRELVDLLRAGLAEHGLALPARGARGWPVWGYDPRRPVSAARVLTVGDAAGIDGLTGEGIAVAMEQAIVAGDLVHAALGERRFGFEGYRRALRRAVVGRELALDRRLARMLYDTDRWLDWLALVLCDPDMIDLYARRVDGTEILADQKLRLIRALVRHLARRAQRRSVLVEASGLELFTATA